MIFGKDNGEEDWSATIRKVDENVDEPADRHRNVIALETGQLQRDRMAGLT